MLCFQSFRTSCLCGGGSGALSGGTCVEIDRTETKLRKDDEPVRCVCVTSLGDFYWMGIEWISSSSGTAVSCFVEAMTRGTIKMLNY